MLRLFPLLLLLFAGCQRPVTAVLTYAPDPAAADNVDSDSIDMNRVLAVVGQRLRYERLPCRASLDESQQIRIEAYDDSKETLDRIDDLVLAMGTFELRIVANADDHPAQIQQAKETDASEIRDEKGRLLCWWVPIDEKAKNEMLKIPDFATREVESEDGSTTELLVVNDPYQVNGTLLKRAAPGIDQSGRPNITFVLTSKGGDMMAGLTTENLPDLASGRTRKLAIIFNNHVFSAPAIQSTIRERGEITGKFTKQEVNTLVNLLNSGGLPTPLTRLSIEHVDSP